MNAPTPGRWASTEWREDTLEWGMRALSRHGLTLRAWTQPHARPWSTALRLETDADPVWLKAPGDGALFEVPLLVLLAELEMLAGKKDALADTFKAEEARVKVEELKKKMAGGTASGAPGGAPRRASPSVNTRPRPISH